MKHFEKKHVQTVNRQRSHFPIEIMQKAVSSVKKEDSILSLEREELPGGFLSI